MSSFSQVHTNVTDAASLRGQEATSAASPLLADKARPDVSISMQQEIKEPKPTANHPTIRTPSASINEDEPTQQPLPPQVHEEPTDMQAYAQQATSNVSAFQAYGALLNTTRDGTEDDKNPRCICWGCICHGCRDWLCYLCGIVTILILAGIGIAIYYQWRTGGSSAVEIGVPSQINFTNSAQGSDYIYLQWASAQPNGAVVQSYQLQSLINNGNEGWYNVSLNDNGLYNHANITGLRANTSFSYRIRARNSEGFSDFSKILFIITNAAVQPSAPSAPFGLDAMSLNEGMKLGLISQLQINEAVQLYSNDGIDDDDIAKTLAVLTMGFTASSDGGNPISEFILLQIQVSNIGNGTTYQPFCNVTIPTYDSLDVNKVYNCSGIIGESDVYEILGMAMNDIDLSDESLSTPCIIPYNAVSFWMCNVHSAPNAITQLSYAVTPYEIDLQWQPPTTQSRIEYYQLQRDDWWNGTGLDNVSLSDGGLSLSASIANLLPGITYHIRIRGFSTYGGGVWSNLLSITTNDTGACGNAHDLEQQKENYDTMQSAITKAFIQCITSSDPDTCAQKKIEDSLGFSADCAMCWVEDGDCNESECAKQCINPNSSKCYECSVEKCFPAAVICTGLPMWTFPPP